MIIMTKTVLAMLFGALVASFWWSLATFGDVGNGFSTIFSFLLSIVAVIWIGHETFISNW